MIKDSAKTIVCYGDSNTWGNIPRTDDRYPRSIRWPGALQNLLGEDYEVISEGLCGRTLVANDPAQLYKTGITPIQAILESHDPLHLVIIMLGTNDIKDKYNLQTEDIAGHLDQVVKLIRGIAFNPVPKILIICPPPIIIPITNDLNKSVVRGIELFKTLPELYKKVAEENACGFINSGDHISSGKVDGYHFDKEGHLKLAEIVKTWILK